MKLNALATALALGFAAAASAQTTGPVKIGFITDMSSLYADIDGPAGGEMIKWAVQDFGGKVLGRPVEVLTADHQNKADVASSKAREWIDKESLAMLVGGTNSGTALAMAKERFFVDVINLLHEAEGYLMETEGGGGCASSRKGPPGDAKIVNFMKRPMH